MADSEVGVGNMQNENGTSPGPRKDSECTKQMSSAQKKTHTNENSSGMYADQTGVEARKNSQHPKTAI